MKNKKDIPNIVIIIFFTAMIVGLLLGLTINSLQGETIPLVDNLGKVCKSTENTEKKYGGCESTFAAVTILLFLLSILEIFNLRKQMGKYNAGVIIYLLGLIFGFIVSFVF